MEENAQRDVPVPSGHDGAEPGDLADRAIRVFTAYQRTGDRSLLDGAVALFRAALAATAQDRPDRAIYLSNLGGALRALSEATGDAAPLTEAVSVVRAAAGITPAVDPDHAMYLSNLCSVLRALSERTGEVSPAAEAVEAGRAAVAAAPPGHPDHASALANLASSLLTLFRLTGDAATARESADTGRAAVEATPVGHPERAGRLSDFGLILRAQYERSGETAALAEAVEAGRAAAEASTAGGLAHARYLTNLASIMATLARRTGDTPLLREAAGIGRAAVEAHEHHHAARAAALSNLGTILRALFDSTGDVAVLAEAAEAGRQAVMTTPPGDPELAGRLSNLSNSLTTLSQRTGQVTALREAVDAGRRAVASIRAGHPDRLMFLSNLGLTLRAVSDRTGEISALEETVAVAREAAATSAYGPRHAAALANLANALERLFQRTGDTTYGMEAVRSGRQAVAATSADDPERRKRLSNLGTALSELHRRTGEATVLEEAVVVGRDAVAATPAGHPARAAYLSNLGNSLRQLSAVTGSAIALEEAVDITRQAAAAVPGDHPERLGHLVNLATSLRELFERTGDVAAISDAVNTARQAVSMSAGDWPGKSSAMSALGGALQRMAERTGSTADLEEAAQVAREAAALIPAGHADRPGRLSHLGGILQLLFERTGQVALLEEAVDAGRSAVRGIPAEHPSRAAYLSNLGRGLQALHRETGEPETAAAAERCFGEAGQHGAAPAWVRIAAYGALLGLPDRPGRPPDEMLAAAEAAIALLPQVAPRTLARADREHAVSQVQGLASRAAAAALTARRPARAAELLEQARGVLVADALDSRGSDRARLNERAPELAAELDRLHERLDFLDRPREAGPAPPEGPLREDVTSATDPWRPARELADARRLAQAEWDALIGRIRARDGCSEFLRAPDAARLAVQAQDGPIVFIQAAPSRCDALILTPDPSAQVRIVELAAMTQADAYHQANRVLRARRTIADPGAGPARRADAQSEMLGVLAWAWDTVAEPVLDALGYTAAPRGIWPRLWWCPVGVMAYLPWHAAGHHDDLGTTDTTSRRPARTVLDRVVSSYAITVRALAYARARQAGHTQPATVIVAAPDAPGAPHLAGVATEARILADLVPGAREVPDPTRPGVLAALPDHAVAHFACHGLANWADPMASRLMLRDCDIAPLTVADISALHLTGGLAYLSACDTSLTHPSLTDEAVHITGAFHLAGYQHVVGTLWPLSDVAARHVAVDVYRQLTRNGTTPPDIAATAVALHHATRRLRARYPGLPMLWAPLTHTGI